MLRDTDYRDLDDLELVRLVRSGDRKAFDELTRRYYRLAIYMAKEILGDHEAAVDAAQDAFLKAYRAIDTFAGSSFLAWFKTIVKNHARDMVRRARYRQSVEYDDGYAPGSRDRVGGPTEDRAAQEEYMALVHEAYESLSPQHKEVIRLYAFEGRSYPEIAATLGIPKGTVMSRLFHARKKMKEYIQAKQRPAPSGGM